MTSSAQAAVISLDTIDNGWYAQNGVHPSNSTSIWTGTDGSGLYRNSFYNFDVSSLQGMVINSVELVFFASGTYRSQDASETLQIWDVTTTPGQGYSTAVYNDLMTGVMYAEADVFGTFKSAMPQVSLSLSSLSFSDILSDSFFSVGATVSTLNPTSQQVLWWGTDSLPAAQLIIDYSTGSSVSVSEPNMVILISLLMLCLATTKRRFNNT